MPTMYIGEGVLHLLIESVSHAVELSAFVCGKETASMSCRQPSVDVYCSSDARDAPNYGSQLYPVTSREYSIMCDCSNTIMLVYIYIYV